MTLREELDALERECMAEGGTNGAFAYEKLCRALSLCRRAVEEAESKEGECVAWNEAANGYDAEIASLRSEGASLRGTIVSLRAEVKALEASVERLEEMDHYSTAYGLAAIELVEQERDALRGEADALRSRLAEAEGLLRSTRDRLKFEANSDGGAVARIDAFLAMEWKTCPDCKGTGCDGPIPADGLDDAEPCDHCNGTGEER